MKICKCGCGEVIKPENIFIKGHANNGKKLPPRSKAIRQKISIALKGKKKPPHSEEHRRKIGIGNKGKTRSAEIKLATKEAMNRPEVKAKRSGENSHFWIEDRMIVETLYPKDCTQEYRDFIRERDNHTCQICGIVGMERKMDTHHIDYDKRNSEPDNLITLCISCHRKTNFNREVWKNILQKSIYQLDLIPYCTIENKSVSSRRIGGVFE